MIPVKQTKFVFYDDNGIMVQKGNCFAACIASLMERNITDVLNVEELYVLPDWEIILQRWLNEHKWEWRTDMNFNCFHDRLNYATEDDMRNRYYLQDDYYLISGKTVRNIQHLCIYKAGILIHDPHPSNEGLITFEVFETIKPL